MTPDSYSCFVIEGDDSTDLLPRVAGVLSQHDMPIRRLSLRREASGSRIYLRLARIDPQSAERVVGRLEKIVSVSRVHCA